MRKPAAMLDMPEASKASYVDCEFITSLTSRGIVRWKQIRALRQARELQKSAPRAKPCDRDKET